MATRLTWVEELEYFVCKRGVEVARCRDREVSKRGEGGSGRFGGAQSGCDGVD